MTVAAVSTENFSARRDIYTIESAFTYMNASDKWEGKKLERRGIFCKLRLELGSLCETTSCAFWTIANCYVRVAVWFPYLVLYSSLSPFKSQYLLLLAEKFPFRKDPLKSLSSKKKESVARGKERSKFWARNHAWLKVITSEALTM